MRWDEGEVEGLADGAEDEEDEEIDGQGREGRHYLGSHGEHEVS